MDKISIIVPIYNVEEYLEKCVESIINQTYTNIEIILVDDGSPDNCGKMCDLFAEKDSRIKVIHKKNGGLSDARNAGIDVATGEYLMFIDSDDYIDKTMCEKLYNALKSQKTDISICDVIKVDSNYKIISDTLLFNTSPLVGEKINKEELIDKLKNINYWLFVVAWNKLYHKSIFEKIRFPFGKIHEDEILFNDLLNIFNSMAIVPEKLYYYVQRDNSIVNSKKSIRNLDAAEAFFRRAEILDEFSKKETVLTSIDWGLNILVICYQFSKESSDNKKRFDEVYKIYKKIYKKTCTRKFGLRKRLRFFIAYLSMDLLLFIQKIK